jgi:hypothetical protein
MLFTYISDHDLKEHTTFDIKKLWETNSENDDVNNCHSISTSTNARALQRGKKQDGSDNRIVLVQVDMYWPYFLAMNNLTTEKLQF